MNKGQFEGQLKNAISILLQALSAVVIRESSLPKSVVQFSGESSGASVHPPPTKIIHVHLMPENITINGNDSNVTKLPFKKLPQIAVTKVYDAIKSLQMKPNISLEKMELCVQKKELYGKRKLTEVGADVRSRKQEPGNQGSKVLQSIEEVGCSQANEVAEMEDNVRNDTSCDYEIRSKVPRTETYNVDVRAKNAEGNMEWAASIKGIFNKETDMESNVQTATSSDGEIQFEGIRKQERPFTSFPAGKKAVCNSNYQSALSGLKNPNNKKESPEKKKVTFSLPAAEEERMPTSAETYTDIDEPEVITID